VPLSEPPWVRTLPGRLHLDVTDERIPVRDSEVRAGLELPERRLAHQGQLHPQQTVELGDVRDEGLERVAQLVLRFAVHRDRTELALGCRTVRGDDRLQ